MAQEGIRAKCVAGEKLDLGLAHIADAATDYSGMFDASGNALLDASGNVVAETLVTALAAKVNAVLKRLEDAGVSKTS